MLNAVSVAKPFDRATYMACHRIMELVALGNEVSLFTYQRATARSYRFRTVFLRFKNRRLFGRALWPPEGAYSPEERSIVERREKH